MDISSTDERVRALTLLSGGLDSQLAVCVLRDQGIDVHGVVFESPFFFIGAAKKAAVQLGIPLHIVDFSADIIELLNDPPHGFGSCMNPCIDCHARMIFRARALMEELGAKFLATGEVLDERPMSQRRQALAMVARDSGCADVLVRPLSAARLPETIPEQKGWVDRARLLDLHGRSRRRQFELAAHYGIREYPSPAGGCRLTEPNFSQRLRDLKDHEGLDGVRSLNLLKFGRHFRLSERLKVIVGRNESDNTALEGTAELYDIILKIEGVPGPTGLLPFTASEEDIRRGAAICARYSSSRLHPTVDVRVRTSRGARVINVVPARDEDIEPLRIG